MSKDDQSTLGDKSWILSQAENDSKEEYETGPGDPRFLGADSLETVDWQEVEKILEREPNLFDTLKIYVTTHKKPDIDMLAVTAGPGLEPALWVGINFARALSLIWDIPLLPINHMEGHLASVLLDDKVGTFPALALLISGGHTELIRIEKWGSYDKIGQTLDDAVGEAYDKVARMLGLPYPGGPEISKLAEMGRRDTVPTIVFPRPMMHSGDYNFSFSGLKTAVLYKVQELGTLSDTQKIEIATAFEDAVTEVLVHKVKKAIQEYNAESLIVGGGVIANTHLRNSLQTLAEEEGVQLYVPDKALTTDNAVMIAMAAYISQFSHTATVCPDIKAEGNWSVANL
jgi:N6-L-threonylcarbamoyladenine synthase